MKFPKGYTLKKIADLLECSFFGEANFPVTGLNEIHVVQEGDIVFVDHPKYYSKALQSKATTILIDQKVEVPEGKSLLISKSPFKDFNTLIKHFNPFQKSDEMVSKTAKIGKNSIIQPGVFIGNNVKIGNDCLIHPNVTLYDDTVIGDRVIIHSGTVIGADAFYYKNNQNNFEKLNSCGNVVIENDVEIGGNCTIDRGVTSSTVIGEMSKLDNQIQIGHDTVIGRKCLFASQVGVAGCCVIGNEVTFWGQSGVTSGVNIGDKATIAAKSGVSKTLEGNKIYFGIPAEDIRTSHRYMAAIKQLPRIIKQLKIKV